MEILALIIALVGGVFYFKRKADKNAIEGKLANTKGKDRMLAERQAEIEEAIRQIDDGIAKMREEREKAEKKHKYRSLKERADEAKGRYKK